MGDDKKKSGGKKSGLLFKVAVLAILCVIGAEIFAKMTGKGEWSPYVRVMRLIKAQR